MKTASRIGSAGIHISHRISYGYSGCVFTYDPVLHGADSSLVEWWARGGSWKDLDGRTKEQSARTMFPLHRVFEHKGWEAPLGWEIGRPQF